MKFRRILSLGCAVALAISACTPEGNGDGNGEVVQIDAGSAADMAVDQDLIASFCARSAQAKCEWVFGCLNGSPQITTVFGFAGPMVSDCAAEQEQACLADLRDREMRGTINDLDPAAVDNCVNWLNDTAPCVGGDPSDWVGQFRMAYDGFCTSVVRGNVQTGDPCQSRTDCANKSEVCLGGTCGITKADDLLQPCANLGPIVGSMVPDDTCNTGLCVNTGNGGMCTVDCSDGNGCAGGNLVCLSLTVPGSPPNSFCSLTCTMDTECRDFACQTVNEGDPEGDTYCFGKAR